MAKDLYEVLGVAKTATDAEIKSAYKKLAIKMHPDKFATAGEKEKKIAEDKFKELTHAYQVLGDAQKRATYDQYGSEEAPQGFGGGGFGGFGGDAGGGGFAGGGFDDILNSFFGGSFGGGRSNNPNSPERGEDIQIRVNLTFREAYDGVKKTINLRRNEECSSCHGTGANDPSSIKTCPYCKGTGYIKKVQNTIFGQQVVQTVCSSCGGKGKIVGDKCKTCRGAGYVNKEATVTVNIPAGIDSGIKMTIRNEGNCGANGGGRGDLVLVLYVNGTDKFKRVGTDLYIDVPVSFYAAACGSEITLDTMKGQTKFKLPEGTQTGSKIRLKGYGMQVLQKETFGDLYIVVKVETPKGLSSKQAKLLKEFEDSLSPSQYPDNIKFKKQ